MRKSGLSLASLGALALTAALAVGAAAQDASAAPEPSDTPVVGVYSIEGMEWLLTSQVVDGEMQPVPDGVTVSLYMRGGAAGGSGGCNRYFADYALDGFDLSFGPIGATQMYCEGDSDVEVAYFANLGAVAAYQSGGIQMALLDANGDFLLEFDLAPEATVVGSWVAQGINNGNEAVVSDALTPTVTAEFGADGVLSGIDGCNQYTTVYEVDGASITIGPDIASTRMACPDPALGDLSQQYYAALGAASSWSVDASGALELRDDGGALQVRYLPAE
jgi:heat shock protein HslJ